MRYTDKRVIGITGGIGSGKTKVLELLKDNYDIQIIEADKIGHELQAPGEEVYERIVNEFGVDILEPPHIQGKSLIDRKQLGAIVFSNDIKLKLLNSIAHPAIHGCIENMINGSCHKLIFIEAAILTETSLIELIDEIWYIHAEKSVKLDRLQKYRGISKEKAEQVMAKQPDEELFKSKCDVIIDNSTTVDETLRQIKNILDKIQEEHYE